MHTSTPTIIALERRTKPGMAASLVFGIAGTPDRQGWFAVVESDTSGTSYTAKGTWTRHYSRLDGETSWTCDALISPRGIPAYMNGYGARFVRLQPATPEIGQLLDIAVIDLEGSLQ